MFELAKLVKQKYKNFNITAQHLGQVIREKNRTRRNICDKIIEILDLLETNIITV